MAASAIQFFAPDHPALGRTLRGKLEKMKAEKLEDLLVSQDWPDFKQRKGVIDGLQEAITECVEAEKLRGD